MCLCRQPPVHLYDASSSLLENLSHNFARVVNDWLSPLSGGTLPENRFGSMDCPCSDDYIGSSFYGIIANSGHIAISFTFLVILLASPVVLGLGKQIGSKAVNGVLATWVAMVLWGFGVAMIQSEWFGPDWASRAIVHMPVQLAFNVVFLLLVPALPVFLMERGVASIRNRSAHRNDR